MSGATTEPRPASLRDVGAAAGVSTFTASRALAGKPGVSEESRRRVADAAQRLHYVSNGIAAALRSPALRPIAVVTQDWRNPYYAELIQALSRALARVGRAVLVSEIGAADEEERITALAAQRVGALVVTHAPGAPSLRILERLGIPVCLVDAEPPPSHRHLPHVLADNRAASAAVAEHLIAHGRRRWLVVAYPATRATRIDRERGIRDVARAHAPHVDIEVIEGGINAGSAARALGDHLDARGAAMRPDAVYALNIPLAEGCLSELRARGLRVPADLAVIGFDDFQWAPLLHAPLTVVDQRVEEIGARVAALLTGGASPERPRITVPARLVVRESCGCHRSEGSTP